MDKTLEFEADTVGKLTQTHHPLALPARSLKARHPVADGPIRCLRKRETGRQAGISWRFRRKVKAKLQAPGALGRAARHASCLLKRVGRSATDRPVCAHAGSFDGRQRFDITAETLLQAGPRKLGVKRRNH
jgi:hypothetical protein